MNATKDMIEEAARAILRAKGAVITASDEEWPKTIAHYRRMAAEHGETYTSARSLVTDAMRDARAAISAHLTALSASGYVVVKREPTDAMVDACAGALRAHIDALPIEIRNRYRNFKHGLKVPPRMKAVARYKAMIDAALADERIEGAT